MVHLESMWNQRNRARVLLFSALLLLAIAVADWLTKPFFSMGFLYLFPIMLTAGYRPRWQVAVLGVICAILSEVFSSLPISWVRLTFETLALTGCGLFVAELARNRRLTLESQEKFRVFVETSPAAIVTVDDRGFIEIANHSAMELLSSGADNLIGHPIAAFLPELHQALRKEEGPQFRASMQCHARRANGESFTADVWFSTYKEGSTPKLAAIIAEASENGSGPSHPLPGNRERLALSQRETDVLRYVVQGLSNKEIAARMQVSESTVKNTLQQLFSKTDVRTRGQLVRVALELYRDLL